MCCPVIVPDYKRKFFWRRDQVLKKLLRIEQLRRAAADRVIPSADQIALIAGSNHGGQGVGDCVNSSAIGLHVIGSISALW